MIAGFLAPAARLAHVTASCVVGRVGSGFGGRISRAEIARATSRVGVRVPSPAEIVPRTVLMPAGHTSSLLVQVGPDRFVMKADSRTMKFVFDKQGKVTRIDVTYPGDSTVYAVPRI